MPLSRRQFLASTAASLALPRFARASTLRLVAGQGAVQLAPVGYPATPVWAFNGLAPGPELRFPQGARFSATLENALEEDTTIHWHGLTVPNAMDGVPGLTQDPVRPGETFDYAFDLPDAGTFWYHSHANSVEQVARGLSGPFIVEEADPPDVDGDDVLFLSDWRLVQPADISDDFDNWHDRSHAGRIGNFVTINGVTEWSRPVARHDRLRLRLINGTTARIFELGIKGLSGRIVAVDGLPLESVLPIGQIFLAPAQRVDLIVDVTGTADEDVVLYEAFQGQQFALATFLVKGERPEGRRGDIATLPPSAAQVEMDLDVARIEPMIMEGGAMRGIRRAIYRGEEADGAMLAQLGQFWALAGQVGMSDTPFLSASVGDVLRIPLINQTAFPHAIHLHGYPFREVTGAGLGLWRDTILVDPGQTREIAFKAQHPGKWLLHCHMLSHGATGMMTWIEVV